MDNSIFTFPGQPLVSAEKAKEIWTTLSQIDVTPYVEKKVGLTYLPWAWAWGMLMEHYPDSNFHFERHESGSEVWFFPDGSCEVRCVLNVSGVTRRCWLPVMDNRNNAVKEPDARDINDTKMRCLVKTIALFGLGHYIFAGESAPASKEAKAEAEEAIEDLTVSAFEFISKAANAQDAFDRTKKVVTGVKNRGNISSADYEKFKADVVAYAKTVVEQFNDK